MTHELKTQWNSTPDGKIFEVTAVEPTTGKVVARASCTVPRDVGDDLALYFGADGLAEVERSVRDACEQLARRVAAR